MVVALANLDAETLYRDAVEAGEENEGRILVLDNFGVVQADSYSEYNGMQFSRSEVATVLDGADSDYNYYEVGGDAGHSLLGNGGLSRQMMMGVYTAAIMEGDQRIGVLVYVAMAPGYVRQPDGYPAPDVDLAGAGGGGGGAFEPVYVAHDHQAGGRAQ